jgi:hypothetical protein
MPPAWTRSCSALPLPWLENWWPWDPEPETDEGWRQLSVSRGRGLPPTPGWAEGELDPDEIVVDLSGGHPASPPLVWRVCVLGACGSGKSSLVHRITSRSFDPELRPSRCCTQHFYCSFGARGAEHTRERLFELEDTPGASAGDAGLAELLAHPAWFERRRGDAPSVEEAEDGGRYSRPPHAATPHALLAAERPGAEGAWSEPLALLGCAEERAGTSKRAARPLAPPLPAPQRPTANPIASDRRRVAFLVCADLTSRASLATAHGIVEALLERVEFDAAAPQVCPCPVAVLLLGTKAECSRRDVPPEPELGAEVLRRYGGAVGYSECSAASGAGAKIAVDIASRRVGHRTAGAFLQAPSRCSMSARAASSSCRHGSACTARARRRTAATAPRRSTSHAACSSRRSRSC